jgi:hypothetical protein
MWNCTELLFPIILPLFITMKKMVKEPELTNLPITHGQCGDTQLSRINA